MVVLLCAALAGCVRVNEEPVQANGPTTLTPKYNTQASPNVQVTIYKDPGGCQYLVFYEMKHSYTVAVVPRMDDEFRGACISSDTP